MHFVICSLPCPVEKTERAALVGIWQQARSTNHTFSLPQSGKRETGFCQKNSHFFYLPQNLPCCVAKNSNGLMFSLFNSMCGNSGNTYWVKAFRSFEDLGPGWLTASQKNLRIGSIHTNYLFEVSVWLR